MPCYRPLIGYRSKDRNQSGKRSIVFNPAKALGPGRVKLPCGQCIHCRLERSRQWAIRCVHESKLHPQNSFITLTYSDKNLPPNSSLQLSDFQKFLKRLRKKISPQKLRFFHCGEYGENLGRPHYHALLFGFDFEDKYPFKQSRNGEIYYRSPTLEELWPSGQSMIGSVTFESAAYVARYISKKITGPDAEDHYAVVDLETSETLGQKKPEYVTMSRRPGIGKHWFEKYSSDVFPSDEIVLRGKRLKPPKFYTNLLDEPSREAVKSRRESAAHHENLRLRRYADLTSERLMVREIVHETQAQQLKRTYENGET